jgi:hypothetical protein
MPDRETTDAYFLTALQIHHPTTARSTQGTSAKYRCKEIGSWDKAQALLKQGHTYLDRDGDGEACESLK